MKKIAIIMLLITGVFLGYYLGIQYKRRRNISDNKQAKTVVKKKPVQKAAIKSKSIFVPDWNLDLEKTDLSGYDTVIYFGIIANYRGINKDGIGYRSLPAFTKVSAGKKKLITLRMIDDDINYFVLQNEEIQKNIITETLELLEQYQLDGIVLDLEISGLFKENLTAQINDFVQQIYSHTNDNYRKFYVAIYGDNFYRRRPFDIPFIGKNSDGIMLMAYDFHKSRGEPGPNFPYDSGPASAEATAGTAKYPYNFKKMISDFSAVVPKNKLTVIFGMFGYDWLVDEKKRPIRQAEALSLNEIKKKFIEKCELKDCVIKRDGLSGESEINYIISAPTPDEQQIYRIDYHIVWFEDEESVKVKTDYLREQGISNISYWALGYF